MKDKFTRCSSSIQAQCVYVKSYVWGQVGPLLWVRQVYNSHFKPMRGSIIALMPVNTSPGGPSPRT